MAKSDYLPPRGQNIHTLNFYIVQHNNNIWVPLSSLFWPASPYPPQLPLNTTSWRSFCDLILFCKFFFNCCIVVLQLNFNLWCNRFLLIEIQVLPSLLLVRMELRLIHRALVSSCGWALLSETSPKVERLASRDMRVVTRLESAGFPFKNFLAKSR